jgi:hypothetical protein
MTSVGGGGLGPRHPWLTWTFRGLGILGYVGLLGLVIPLSSEGSRSSTQDTGARRSGQREEKQAWNWKSWLVLGLLAIPAFVFGGLVLNRSRADTWCDVPRCRPGRCR